MSIFNELLPKIIGISKSFSEKFNEDLQDAFRKIDKFEEECKNARGKTRDKIHKDKYIMQSILEDEDSKPKETEETTELTERRLSNESNIANTGKSSTESDPEKPRRNSKKRNKTEVDGIYSPKQEKRQKRNASVKAQTNITKQVNVNLNQKMRRENSTEKKEKTQKPHNGKLRDDEDKENSEPMLQIKIKQEKISLSPECTDVELPAIATEITTHVEVKQEISKDDIAMPPPAVPVPKPRKALRKNKSIEEETSDDEPANRRSTRTKKQKESITVPPSSTEHSSRALRASSRASKRTETTEEFAAPPEPRPKRTRAKKKVTEAANDEVDKDTQSSQDSGIASPAEKPRPKRTRRAAKAQETKLQESEDIPTVLTTKNEIITEPLVKSPILMPSKKFMPNAKGAKTVETEKIEATVNGISEGEDITLDQTRVIPQQDVVHAEAPLQEMDQTMILSKAVYSHDQVTPKAVKNMNETIVLRKCDETIVLDKTNKIIMDATVVIDKEPKNMNLTEDNSIMTDDSESHTPPKQNIPLPQPISAVKEKVQQFEELASRVTRTKTRAMAKNEEQQVPAENQTPPDRIVKQILPMETLQKMNSMIFNGKPPMVTTSANKPRVNGLFNTGKSQISASTSKLSAVKKAKEAAEEIMLREKEDARKKKEAILEAKKEQQRRKREEKMAAAAAAREAAYKERQVALEAAARERMDRQAHADLGKIERLKEVERKKQELARKVAVTEERRKAEEQARQLRLEEDQKRAEALRRKQLEESEALKKEAAIMAREIEKKQKEYKEKQKLKHRFDDKITTPLKDGRYVMEPVRMEDGFQYLVSDDEDSDRGHSSGMPIPQWCMSKYRNSRLVVQAMLGTTHVDRLFSVRVHSPNLAEIFPNIDRSRLKRTSSAVWRTPPGFKRPDN